MRPCIGSCVAASALHQQFEQVALQGAEMVIDQGIDPLLERDAIRTLRALRIERRCRVVGRVGGGSRLLPAHRREADRYAIRQPVAVQPARGALTLPVALHRLQFVEHLLAALLAVIGYSLNDTIVVFDRIRENFRTMRSGTPIEVMNTSINQTLTRTVITSGTTLFVVLSLFVFGGKIINGFSLALLIGIVVGTYSSIFVASMIVLRLGITREDLMPVEKEGAELDAIP